MPNLNNLDTAAESTYREDVDTLWKEYEPKARKLLQEMGKVFEGEGWTIEGIDDLSDEECSLWLAVTSPDGKACAVRLTLIESACREGSEEGIAFSVDLDAPCGHLIGGMTPYNYSGELWVPLSDPEAIARRWQLFEDADPNEALYVLDEHLSTCKEGAAE